MLPKREAGLTLPELTITLAVLAIVLAFSAPSFQTLQANQHAVSVKNNISRVFALARISAIKENQIVTICPLDNAGKCSTDWQRDASVFVDPQSQLQLSPNTRTLRILAIASSGQLTPSNSFNGPRRYFQYRPDGTIRSTLGNLTWCPDTGNPGHGIQVRVNAGGRLTWSKDETGDGIVNSASGKNISC